MFLSTACVCHQHVGAYLRLLAISGVCDKHAGASFRLLPTVSVLDQYLGPSLRLHSIAAGLWEYSFGVCLLFPRDRLLAISCVCDKHAGASFRLLPTASVFNQHLHPLGFTPLQQVYGKIVLDGFFGFFTIATSVFGHCLIFCRQIIVFFQIFQLWQWQKFQRKRQSCIPINLRKWSEA